MPDSSIPYPPSRGLRAQQVLVTPYSPAEQICFNTPSCTSNMECNKNEHQSATLLGRCQHKPRTERHLRFPTPTSQLQAGTHQLFLRHQDMRALRHLPKTRLLRTHMEARCGESRNSQVALCMTVTRLHTQKGTRVHLL